MRTARRGLIVPATDGHLTKRALLASAEPNGKQAEVEDGPDRQGAFGGRVGIGPTAPSERPWGSAVTPGLDRLLVNPEDDAAAPD